MGEDHGGSSTHGIATQVENLSASACLGGCAIGKVSNWTSSLRVDPSPKVHKKVHGVLARPADWKVDRGRPAEESPTRGEIRLGECVVATADGVHETVCAVCKPRIQGGPLSLSLFCLVGILFFSWVYQGIEDFSPLELSYGEGRPKTSMNIFSFWPCFNEKCLPSKICHKTTEFLQFPAARNYAQDTTSTHHSLL